MTVLVIKQLFLCNLKLYAGHVTNDTKQENVNSAYVPLSIVLFQIGNAQFTEIVHNYSRYQIIPWCIKIDKINSSTQLHLLLS